MTKADYKNIMTLEAVMIDREELLMVYMFTNKTATAYSLN